MDKISFFIVLQSGLRCSRCFDHEYACKVNLFFFYF